MLTPPSTSGTPSSSACASKPVPTRYSDTRESLRQLGERADRDGFGRRVDLRVRAPADPDGVEPRRERRQHVVVDAVADVEDLARGDTGFTNHSGEESGIGLLDAPAHGGADEIDVPTEEVLVHDPHVSSRAEPEAARTKRRKTGERVVVEVTVAEDEFADALRLPA